MGEEDVLGLDVAVDHAVRVHEAQHTDQLPHHMQRIRLGEPATLDNPFEEGTALGALHDDQQALRRLEDLLHLHHVWVRELRQHAALGAETRNDERHIRLPAQRRLVHDLDGQWRRVGVVARRRSRSGRGGAERLR